MDKQLKDYPNILHVEHRFTDDSSFVAEGMGHLRLYLTPCTRGDKGGPAGGVVFLVRAEFEQAGLITDHRSITTEGFYGAEEFAAELTLKHKTCTIKWISTYVRQRSGTEHDAYEHKKPEKLSTLKGNLLVMGDINGTCSIMYTKPREQWTKRGLESQTKDAEARNSQMEKIGHQIKRMWNKMQMTDISSKGDLKWEYTRDEENNEGIKVKNKLDVISVSSNLIKQCNARVTCIGDPTGIADTITDHKLLIARLNANNLIRAK